MNHGNLELEALESGIVVPKVVSDALARGRWAITARDPNGKLLALRSIPENLVVDEGLDYLLSVGLAGGAQDTTWFIGLTDSAPTFAAGDQITGTHAGWAEFTNYDEAGRQGFTPGAVASQSVDNTASAASFTISAGGGTIGGAFLAADGTKGGTTGLLYGGGPFTGGDVVLSASSTLNVEATFTAAAV